MEIIVLLIALALTYTRLPKTTLKSPYKEHKNHEQPNSPKNK
jgi:hypothetical protein